MLSNLLKIIIKIIIKKTRKFFIFTFNIYNYIIVLYKQFIVVMARNDTYKCSVCGNVVTLNHSAGGKLVCCGKEMQLLTENTKEGAGEKHIPVLSKVDDFTYKVKVGEVEHPMTPEHYIEYIEIFTENDIKLTFFLKDKPEVTFRTPYKILKINSYCNLHNLWTLNLE